MDVCTVVLVASPTLKPTCSQQQIPMLYLAFRPKLSLLTLSLKASILTSSLQAVVPFRRSRPVLSPRRLQLLGPQILLLHGLLSFSPPFQPLLLRRQRLHLLLALPLIPQLYLPEPRHISQQTQLLHPPFFLPIRLLTIQLLPPTYPHRSLRLLPPLHLLHILPSPQLCPDLPRLLCQHFLQLFCLPLCQPRLHPRRPLHPLLVALRLHILFSTKQLSCASLLGKPPRNARTMEV
mmetsp:Transcript_37500/g.73808  ORF Transcript_37500/g.73808 Transcript_37500/m.73808 type:complete len:235 (+) Transcript_37500:1942-2646(+)